MDAGQDKHTFDMALLCKATGWCNNCGLNCLVHFIGDKIAELNNMPVDSPYFAKYDQLLNEFQQYYGLPLKYTWAEIGNLLRQYPNPKDKEVLLAPVLRKALGGSIHQKAPQLWDIEFANIFEEYIEQGALLDPEYQSNVIAIPEIKAFLQQQRALYLQFEDQSKKTFSMQELEILAIYESIMAAARQAQGENRKRLFEQERDLRKENPIINQYQATMEEYKKTLLAQSKVFFLAAGSRAYGSYMGALENKQQVSADDLSFFAKTLGIDMAIYTGLQGDDLYDVVETLGVHEHWKAVSQDFSWQFRVLNQTKGHWEYEGEVGTIAEHNKWYERWHPAKLWTANENVDIKNNAKRAVAIYFLEKRPVVMIEDSESEEEDFQIGMNNAILPKKNLKRPRSDEETKENPEKKQKKETEKSWWERWKPW